MITTSPVSHSSSVLAETSTEQRPHAILFDLDTCKVHGVASDVITIGRSNRCTITVQENVLSRQHCMIVRATDGYRIYDLNSESGVSVNGVRVRENALLCDGDEITLGSQCLVFNTVERAKMPDAHNSKTRISWVQVFGNYLRGMRKRGQ